MNANSEWRVMSSQAERRSRRGRLTALRSPLPAFSQRREGAGRAGCGAACDLCKLPRDRIRQYLPRRRGPADRGDCRGEPDCPNERTMSTSPTAPVPAKQVHEFFDAIDAGRHEDIRAMLRAAPGLASRTDERCFGSTPLVRAAGANDQAAIDILLEAGSDPNQRNDWWAGGFGVLDDCTDETAAYLLKRGATLTPHAAARLGMVDALRDMLARDSGLVRQRGGDGQLPLHFSRSVEVAELLLAHGAEIDARDVDHESTAAQWLATSRPEVAAYLVQRGATPDLFMAAMIGDLARLQRLAADDADGPRARVTRARFATSPKAAGHIYLFTIGERCTLLHAAAAGACVSRPSPATRVQKDGTDDATDDAPDDTTDDAGVIRWLTSAGASVSARGGYDDATPLHTAAWRDRAEAAAALLDAGAEIDARSGVLHNNEPVGWAIVSGAVAVVRLLLARGCRLRDVHVADAKDGARGRFQQLNRTRPSEAWREIERLLVERRA